MAKYRILVIDDTRVIRLSLKSLLEKIGVEVLELGNAEDLFQSSWRFHNLDLIFLDIDLPGMNGMTALIKIKESPKWTGVPIIMLTSYADPVVVKQAIQAGVVDYVKKPFTAETLLRRVKTLLNMPNDAAFGNIVSSSPDATASPPETPLPDSRFPLSPYSVAVEIDPAGQNPAGLVALLQPQGSSGLQIAGTVTLTIPFQFPGNLEAATAAIEAHLKKHQLLPGQCNVTSAL